MPGTIQHELKQVIDETADELLFEMQSRVAVSGEAVPTDTSGNPREHLIAALDARVAKNGLSARIGLVTPKLRSRYYFWYFLEYGTKKMSKQPFAEPAIDNVMPRRRRELKAKTLKALRKVARSRPSDA